VRQAAAEQGLTDFMALWAGQGCHLCEERPAGELIAAWAEQVAALLGKRERPESIQGRAPVTEARQVSEDASVDPACLI
jgi:nitronate monooxygenase